MHQQYMISQNLKKICEYKCFYNKNINVKNLPSLMLNMKGIMPFVLTVDC